MDENGKSVVFQAIIKAVKTTADGGMEFHFSTDANEIGAATWLIAHRATGGLLNVVVAESEID